ncbi:DUF6360 family protein [Haloterrigena salinisoli]|uniref:DUF6360 family protein n=1 Tax=Haloterrigena salinisoli TaxID=3132747 RepID=UPI0030CA65C1
MSDRLMTVNAYTTLDYVEAVAKGATFEWESVAVVNATADDEQPDAVHLRLELDNLSEEHLPKHMEDLELTPDQARALAADLEKHADRVDDAQSDE